MKTERTWQIIIHSSSKSEVYLNDEVISSTNQNGKLILESFTKEKSVSLAIDVK